MHTTVTEQVVEIPSVLIYIDAGANQLHGLSSEDPSPLFVASAEQACGKTIWYTALNFVKVMQLLHRRHRDFLMLCEHVIQPGSTGLLGSDTKEVRFVVSQCVTFDI